MKIVEDLVAHIATAERERATWITKADHTLLLANQLVIMRALLVLLTSKPARADANDTCVGCGAKLEWKAGPRGTMRATHICTA